MKRDKSTDLARELKMIGTGIGGLENERTSKDHPNYSIIYIDQNTEKNPGELKRLAVTQTPATNHRITLV